ncbi:hypothetical protein [Streptomyces sp. NPDC053367]|uniref:hypothetical protein n=1 Tax=Streptomyces sp. NPDC053367 TaxID=3365700 RepID=UPI0037D7FFB0
MVAGGVAILAAAWRPADPLDAVARQWIRTVVVACSLALVFEDVRDTGGDRAVGRRTAALVLGAWPVRLWFAALLTAIPVVAHILLFAPTGADPARIALCDAALATAGRVPAVRALVLRHRDPDRVTYQLYIVSYVVVLSAGPVLWS